MRTKPRKVTFARSLPDVSDEEDAGSDEGSGAEVDGGDESGEGENEVRLDSEEVGSVDEDAVPRQKIEIDDKVYISH